MATPTSNTHPITGNPSLDGLIQGSSWQFGGGARTLTYTLNVNDTSVGGTWGQYPALTAALRQALAEWSMVANISFDDPGVTGIYNDSTADMAVTLTGDELSQALQAVSLGIFPDPIFASLLREAAQAEGFSYPRPEGDLFFDNYLPAFQYTEPGGIGRTYLLHEIGHALGLKHPNDDGGNLRPTFASLGIAHLDNAANTLMSYGAISATNLQFGNPSTPMLLDILAIQHLYGANASTNSGDTTYGLREDNAARTIWDASGIDTFDASVLDSPGGITIDLRPGAATTVDTSTRVTIAYNVMIENGIGTAYPDTILGNDVDNRLDGRGGNDTMTGGLGNDTYVVDSLHDQIIEAVGAGIDLIESFVGLTLPANVENLRLEGVAGINGMGNTLANIITGNEAGNLLSGGGGTDRLAGAGGDDSYVYTGVETIVEQLNAGNDTIYTANSFTTPVNVEGLVALGADSLNLTGNALINLLVGNAANNILDGGEGGDALVGSLGDDSYVIDSAADYIVEHPNEGRDTAFVIASYLLPANVEGAQALGSSAINLTGNALINILVGNAASNILDGDAGGDALVGGLGDDSYVIDSAADYIVEHPNEGRDTAYVIASYLLPANVEGAQALGSSAVNLTGNMLINILVGNAASNILDGGAGGDALVGGLGDDSYVIDSAADYIVEHPNEGRDTAYVIASATLPTNVEGAQALGSDSVDLTGNGLSNVLVGNSASNILNGGSGVDYLLGRAGNDTYVVDAATEMVIENLAEGHDTVYASVSFVLPANVEGLVALGGSPLDLTGNALSNVLVGNAASNVLNGGHGNDTIIGAAGDDTLIGGLGNDTLDGGADFDRAVFAGNQAAYVTTATASGGATVSGPDGLDTLTGIEQIVFDDATVDVASLPQGMFAHLEGMGPAQVSLAAALTASGAVPGTVPTQWLPGAPPPSDIAAAESLAGFDHLFAMPPPPIDEAVTSAAAPLQALGSPTCDDAGWPDPSRVEPGCLLTQADWLVY